MATRPCQGRLGPRASPAIRISVKISGKGGHGHGLLLLRAHVRNITNADGARRRDVRSRRDVRRRRPREDGWLANRIAELHGGQVLELGQQAPRVFRQGDVLLLPTGAVPAPERIVQDGGTLVLAHGEATGHSHVVESDRAQLAMRLVTRLVSREEAHRLYLLVHGDEPVELRHQEHDTLLIPPGAYKVIRQREYEPGPVESRLVTD